MATGQYGKQLIACGDKPQEELEVKVPKCILGDLQLQPCFNSNDSSVTFLVQWGR